jgi:hypothetical protein
MATRPVSHLVGRIRFGTGRPKAMAILIPKGQANIPKPPASARLQKSENGL